ncbi:MAG: HAD hydrolase family protein, partial [Holdemanella sp.]|nr:HAD hydrolase family protein [Holdemanella sp.]
HLKEDEVLVIGDGFNDSSMFMNFNNSFCMGQSSDELKKLATYTAPSNADHGVAYVINHLLEHNLEINEETI